MFIVQNQTFVLSTIILHVAFNTKRDTRSEGPLHMYFYTVYIRGGLSLKMSPGSRVATYHVRNVKTQKF